jgi:hypothetical protein
MCFAKDNYWIGIKQMIMVSECSSLCPDVYDPVCDTEGRSYGNSCELSVAACNNPGIKSAGRC